MGKVSTGEVHVCTLNTLEDCAQVHLERECLARHLCLVGLSRVQEAVLGQGGLDTDTLRSLDSKRLLC